MLKMTFTLSTYVSFLRVFKCFWNALTLCVKPPLPLLYNPKKSTYIRAPLHKLGQKVLQGPVWRYRHAFKTQNIFIYFLKKRRTEQNTDHLLTPLWEFQSVTPRMLIIMITFEQNSSCVCNIPLLILTFMTHYSCMLCRATKSHKILKRNGKLGKSNTLLFVYWRQIYTYFWQVNINLMLQIQSMSQCVSKQWFSNVQDAVCITWRYSTIQLRYQRRPSVESWISSHIGVLHRLFHHCTFRKSWKWSQWYWSLPSSQWMKHEHDHSWCGQPFKQTLSCCLASKLNIISTAKLRGMPILFKTFNSAKAYTTSHSNRAR